MKPLVSVMASLQNSVPVQAMAPRKKGAACDAETDVVQREGEFGGAVAGDVEEQEVLHDGEAQVAGFGRFAAGETLGEVGSGGELVAGEASAEHAGADVAEAELLLRMNAGVIAEDVVGNGFLEGGIEFGIRCGSRSRRGSGRRSSLLS